MNDINTNQNTQLDDDGMEALMQELTEGEDAVLTLEEAKEFINSFRR